MSETFGYSGTQLTGVTTGMNRTWHLGYDGAGRLISLTSPISGQLGQAGYTPAYTTRFGYEANQAQVVAGVGTSGALTTTDTLSEQGEPTTTADGLGDTSAAQYDTDHDVTSRTDADGNQTQNAYQYVGPTGSIGLITQTVQPAITPYVWTNPTTTVTTTRRYNASNDLIEIDRPEGGVTQYAYDGGHQVITATETVRYVSGCQQSPLRGPSGSLASPLTTCTHTYYWRPGVTQYDAYGERIASIDGRGLVVATTSTTQGASPVVTLGANANQYTRHYAYDAQGDQTSESTPPITTTTRANAPVTTTTGFDGDGEAITSTTANGSVTMDAYDHLGRQVQTTQPSVTLYDGSTKAPTSVTRYDGEGNVVATTDANGATSTSSYDPLGRLVASTNPVSGTTLYTDTATEQTAEQDPQGHVTTSRYDAAGRLQQTTDPTGGVTQYQDDPVGNTTAITSGDGTTPTTVESKGYDSWNRVVTDTVGGPNTTAQQTLTAYDQDGNVFETQQPNGDVTINTYDMADELIQTELDTAPLNGPTNTYDESTTYLDAVALPRASTDFDGRTHQPVYDADNREVQGTDSTAASGGTTTITTTSQFDPDGNTLSRTTQTQDPSGGVRTDSYTGTVNAADWVMSEADNGLVTSYGYDAAGQQRSKTVLNGGLPVTTTLDPEGRTTSIAESGNTSRYGYNQDDLPMTATLPGGTGVQENLSYDKSSRLTHLGLAGPTGVANPLNSSYDYGYTPVGWTNAATSTVNVLNNGAPSVQTFSHNGLGQLTGASGGGTTQAWTYDGNGNLKTSVTNGVTTTYSYNANSPAGINAVQSVSTSGQPTTYYGYDQSGDTSSITSTGGISTGLLYDTQARLAQVTLADGTQVVLRYNSAGLRARYTVAKGGSTSLDERFTYRGDELAQAAVVSGTASYTDTYLYDPTGSPLELLRQQNGATGRYWYEEDGRGNVVALTDSSGNVVDRYGYDAWGAPVAAQTTETVPQPLRYAGYWWDAALGWYWVSVRPYDPALKRWLQPDPSEQDGKHTYVYAYDDPIDYVDTTGSAPEPFAFMHTLMRDMRKVAQGWQHLTRFFLEQWDYMKRQMGPGWAFTKAAYNWALINALVLSLDFA